MSPFCISVLCPRFSLIPLYIAIMSLDLIPRLYITPETGTDESTREKRGSCRSVFGSMGVQFQGCTATTTSSSSFVLELAAPLLPSRRCSSSVPPHTPSLFASPALRNFRVSVSGDASLFDVCSLPLTQPRRRTARVSYSALLVSHALRLMLVTPLLSRSTRLCPRPARRAHYHTTPAHHAPK